MLKILFVWVSVYTWFGTFRLQEKEDTDNSSGIVTLVPISNPSVFHFLSFSVSISMPVSEWVWCCCFISIYIFFKWDILIFLASILFSREKFLFTFLFKIGKKNREKIQGKFLSLSLRHSMWSSFLFPPFSSFANKTSM